MSTESLWEPIRTATVAIFSPDLRQVLLVYNQKLDGLVPPGGKFDPLRDRNILDTALYETSEETWLTLFQATGVFLDEQGQPIDYPLIVSENHFLFPNGRPGHDSLYFFGLHNMPHFKLKPGTFWLEKSKYGWERIQIKERMYQFCARDIQSKVLSIMR